MKKDTKVIVYLLAGFLAVMAISNLPVLYSAAKRPGDAWRDQMYYTSRAITTGQDIDMATWTADVMVTNQGTSTVWFTTGPVPYTPGEGGFANLNTMAVHAGETIALEDFQAPVLRFKSTGTDTNTVVVRAIH